MNQDWKMVKLGEVITNRQIAPDAIKVAMGEIPIISKIGFEKGQVELRNDGKSNTKLISVYPNDLVLSGINAAKGAISINNLQHEIAATIHYSAYYIKESLVDLNFLLFYLRSGVFQDFLKFESANGLKTEIKPKKFLSFEIPLPPLPEQRRIAGRLAALKGNIDAVRRLRGEQVREVERILENAFDFVISDTGFPKKKINEVATFKTGKTPPTSHPHYFEGDLDWYCSSDINNQKDCYLLGSTKKISQAALDDNKATWYEKGTVLLISIGTIGKVGILKEAASSNQQITGIKFDESVLPEFGYYWLKKCKLEILKRAGKATLPIINQKKIGEIEIVLPDLPTQRRIVAEIQTFQTKMEQLKAAQAEQLAGLERLFPAVLERAFRGEW